MENQRLFLWSMFAIVLFFMMQAWQKDYGPKPPLQSTTNGVIVNDTAPVDLNVPGIENPVSSEGIPAAQQSAVKPSSPVRQGQIIKVNTDVYALEISTQGGSLVGLTLPNMPIDICTKRY